MMYTAIVCEVAQNLITIESAIGDTGTTTAELWASSACRNASPVLPRPARFPVMHVSRRRRLHGCSSAPAVYDRQQLRTPASSAGVASAAGDAAQQHRSVERSSAQPTQARWWERHDILAIVSRRFRLLLYFPQHSGAPLKKSGLVLSSKDTQEPCGTPRSRLN